MVFKMIVCRILFLVLSVSVSSGYRFPVVNNNRPHLRFSPANAPTLQLNDEVEDLDSHYNTMIRRGEQPLILGKKHKSRNLKDYDVKIMSLDNLKSLELDDSLENVLALDAQEKQQKEKRNLGFKVVTLNDLDQDRQKSKISNHKKVKLVQSLAPPKNFFKKYIPGDILKSDTAVSNLNIHSSKLSNNYRPKSIKPKAKTKSIFNEDGMMFLTKPKNAEERKLSALINKVLKFKSNQEKQGALRQPKEVFTPDEIKHIKLIARSIDEEDKDDEHKNNALDELFLRDLLQEEVKPLDKVIQKLSKQASSRPLEIKVAVVPPQKNNIHLDLPQALWLLDDDDETRERDDDNEPRERDDFDKTREWADYDETRERYYDDKTRERHEEDKTREKYDDDLIRERYDYEESRERTVYDEARENSDYEQTKERRDDDKTTEKYDDDKRVRVDLAQVIADAIGSINQQRNNDDRNARATHVVDLPGRGSKHVNHNSNKKQQLNQFARAIRSAKSLDEQDAAPAPSNKQQFDFTELVA